MTTQEQIAANLSAITNRQKFEEGIACEQNAWYLRYAQDKPEGVAYLRETVKSWERCVHTDESRGIQPWLDIPRAQLMRGRLHACLTTLAAVESPA